MTKFLRKPFKYTYNHFTIAIVTVNLVIFLLTYLFPYLKMYLAMNVGLIIYKKMYWQFLTYMFIHEGFSHIFFNMIALLIFGRGVEKAIGSKEFLLFYLVCGFGSGLFSFAVYYFTGAYNVFLLGASGAIYSLLLAYAVCFPKSTLYIWGIIPIPAPILVLVYAVIEFGAQFLSSSKVAHMTHLFGFVAAYLYFLIRMGINPIKVWKAHF